MYGLRDYQEGAEMIVMTDTERATYATARENAIRHYREQYVEYQKIQQLINALRGVVMGTSRILGLPVPDDMLPMMPPSNKKGPR